MTAAYRLKGLGWFAGGVVVTLAFYLVSLQVATERKKLEQLNGQIASTERDIRALETEFDTRANLAQLERWNGDTLALSAPQAGQFVRDEAELASISFNGAPMQPGQAEIRTAALIVPSAPLVVSGAPTVMAAAAPAPVTVQRTPPVAPQMAAQTVPTSTRPRITQIATTLDAPHMTIRPAVAMTIAGHARPEVAMLDRKLLSDTTLGDLLSGARAERGRSR